MNASFGPAMRAARKGTQAEYVALEPARDARDDQPSVIALPTPRPYGRYGSIVKWAIEDSLPDATGAFVDWLVLAATLRRPMRFVMYRGFYDWPVLGWVWRASGRCYPGCAVG